MRIKMGAVDVGSLFALDDGRVYFRFDDAYAMRADAERPVLSQSYEASSPEATRRQLLDIALAANRGNGRGALPPFFENLLPEGRLRKHLVELSGVDPADSLGLLAYCGLDLPGNVQAISEELSTPELGRLLGQGQDSFEMSSGQLPTPQGESISGVQPKVALVRDAGGRYVMRSKNGDGHFIGKLPTGDYLQLPEVEHASLSLARAAGVTTCEHELLPLTAIADRLPFELRSDASKFLLVHRFDRDADSANGRRHAEDFAQVTSTQPEEKYSLSYAEVGAALLARSARREADVYELVRRITVNELLGNPDAHLKNYGFLYPTPRTAVLSPAYDIVAYSAYMRYKGHGLALVPGEHKHRLLRPIVLRIWANLWGLPERTLQNTVSETLEAAMTEWPKLLPDLELLPEHRERLWAYVQESALGAKWLEKRARAARRKSAE
ncbi:type II toxin-antitoxin system HipA family toxin [Paraburkholderia sp. UCT31]|uniref:type II toxin-antitoxin system HipA family toxin n=1 Tax=Paraburkholderia sp. UCT31 TaxID=2615209 RepID=UPI00223BB22D|nr:type II toxin-antitoxin system HipA family toxin [Paraburkholderia sp. UCT31]